MHPYLANCSQKEGKKNRNEKSDKFHTCIFTKALHVPPAEIKIVPADITRGWVSEARKRRKPKI